MLGIHGGYSDVDGSFELFKVVYQVLKLLLSLIVGLSIRGVYSRIYGSDLRLKQLNLINSLPQEYEEELNSLRALGVKWASHSSQCLLVFDDFAHIWLDIALFASRYLFCGLQN